MYSESDCHSDIQYMYEYIRNKMPVGYYYIIMKIIVCLHVYVFLHIYYGKFKLHYGKLISNLFFLN